MAIPHYKTAVAVTLVGCVMNFKAIERQIATARCSGLAARSRLEGFILMGFQNPVYESLLPLLRQLACPMVSGSE